jgi:hypothetical protein
LLSYSGGVTTARHSVGNSPTAEAVITHISQNRRSCQAKIFLFWGLIFKTDVDKIKSTTGDGTQDGSYKPEREKNIA